MKAELKQDEWHKRVCEKIGGITFLKGKNGRLIPFAVEEVQFGILEKQTIFPFLPTQQPVLTRKFSIFIFMIISKTVIHLFLIMLLKNTSNYIMTAEITFLRK